MLAPTLLAAALLAWAWWTGRLKGLKFEDLVAAIILILGIRFLATGKIAFALPLLTGAALWLVHRTRRPKSEPMQVEDARRLLGLTEGATLADIAEAHKRLIQKVHPDTGGSTELANRVNIARDTLVAEMSRRTPRAS